MATLIELKRTEFAQALKGLEEGLAMTAELDIVRDVTLMRFIFTSELAWKVARLYIAEKAGAEIVFPKEAYREALKLELLSPEETESMLTMVDDRNRIAHDYSEEFAEALFGRVKNSYSLVLRKLLDRMS